MRISRITLIALLTSFVVISGMTVLSAQDEKASDKASITGEVVDAACYMTRGAKGEKHKACAITCAKKGNPMGILEDGTDKLFISLKPNEDLMAHMAETVTVMGTVVEKGGVRGIDISKVTAAN